MAKQTLRGLERGLSVLSALERQDGISLKDLHRQTRLPKPTLLRILTTLESRGFARRRIADGEWRRSAQKLLPASQLLSLLLDIGGELLDDLCRRVVWPSDLAVYDRGAMQILETTRRLTPFVMTHAGVGLRVPVLQSGLGLAWVAFCTDEEREDIVATLSQSDDPYDRAVHEPDAVDAIVAETRVKGYGARAEGYQPRRSANEEKTCGIALPIFARGRVVAVINMVWILSAFSEEAFVRRYLPDLRLTADEIGRRVDTALAGAVT